MKRTSIRERILAGLVVAAMPFVLAGCSKLLSATGVGGHLPGRRERPHGGPRHQQSAGALSHRREYAFSVDTGPDCSSGRIEPQVGGPFDNVSLNGRYSYGTEGSDVGHRLTAVGTITFDGDKNDDSTEDDATPGGLFPNQPLGVAQYSSSTSSDPVGRGTLDSAGKTVAYIISTTKLVYFNTPASNPRIVVVWKESSRRDARALRPTARADRCGTMEIPRAR